MVHLPRQMKLLLVVEARNASGTIFAPGKRGEKEPRKNGDDRDDDQQLNQCEPALHTAIIFARVPGLHLTI